MRKYRIAGTALLALASLVIATLGPSGIAQTSDEGPPRMDLRWRGHSMQQGSRGSSCWPDANGNGICVDVVGGFPKAMWVRSDAKLKIRIHYAEKPEEFGVAAWLGGERHYYMHAFGAWAPGDASWSFHVRTVKT